MVKSNGSDLDENCLFSSFYSIYSVLSLMCRWGIFLHIECLGRGSRVGTFEGWPGQWVWWAELLCWKPLFTSIRPMGMMGSTSALCTNLLFTVYYYQAKGYDGQHNCTVLETYYLLVPGQWTRPMMGSTTALCWKPLLTCTGLLYWHQLDGTGTCSICALLLLGPRVLGEKKQGGGYAG